MTHDQGLLLTSQQHTIGDARVGARYELNRNMKYKIYFYLHDLYASKYDQNTKILEIMFLFEIASYEYLISCSMELEVHAADRRLY